MMIIKFDRGENWLVICLIEYLNQGIMIFIFQKNLPGLLKPGQLLPVQPNDRRP